MASSTSRRDVGQAEAVGDRVMGQQRERGAVRPADQHRADQRRARGIEAEAKLVGDLPLPVCFRLALNGPQRDRRNGDVLEMRRRAGPGGDAHREQRVQLLHAVERLAPLLHRGAAADHRRGREVDGAPLVDEPEHLLKAAEGADRRG